MIPHWYRTSLALVLVVPFFAAGCGGSDGGGTGEATAGGPANVTASPGTAENIIRWAPSSNAASYTLYWSLTPGVSPANGARVNDVTSPYRHTGLSNGRTYYYVLTATDATGESPASAEVSATPDLGFSWSTRIGGGSRLHSVTYGGGQFVAVGANGSVYLSSDGVQWSPQNTGASSFQLHDVVWARGEYVAAGVLVIGLQALYSPAFLVSLDGRTWSLRSAAWDGLPIASGDATRRVTSLAWSGSAFAAVMGDRVFHSVDGVNWRTVAAVGPARVRWANSRFLLVSEQDGRVMSSSDGITWDTRLTTAEVRMDDIASSGDRYTAVGNNATWGLIASTPDLGSWIGNYWESGNGTVLQRVIWDGSRFTAVGQHILNGEPTVDAVLTSRNGVNWTEAYFGDTLHRFNGIASSGERLVAVGDDGVIMTSP